MSTLLSVNNYYYYRGGAETVFLEHNKLFAAAGWNVVPFSMQHSKNLASEWSSAFIDELELGSDYSLPAKLRRLPKVVYSLEARRKISAVLDRVRPDVCHAHNIYHHLSPSILQPLHRRGIPTVLTLHDLKIACPAYNMLTHDGICERCKGGRIYNVVLNKCIKGSVALSTVIFAEAVLHKLLGSYRNRVSKFIVPSRFFIDKFVEWGFPRSSFVHIPNFVDPEQFEPHPQPGREFVYVGRLAREKGVETLIRAAAKAAVPLKIIGTGPDRDALQALAGTLHGTVEFTGYLTGAPLRAAVASARAVVLPSEWYENAPMSVLESYALGKPVIGARIGGIPELILEQQTGSTFVSGNANDLATQLRTFADANDSRLTEMGRVARSFVEEHFTAALYRERISEVYQALIVSGTTRSTAI